MTDETKAAVVHVLLAQREQINAILRLLTGPVEGVKQDDTKPKPRYLGESREAA